MFSADIPSPRLHAALRSSARPLFARERIYHLVVLSTAPCTSGGVDCLQILIGSLHLDFGVLKWSNFIETRKARSEPKTRANAKHGFTYGRYFEAYIGTINIAFGQGFLVVPLIGRHPIVSLFGGKVLGTPVCGHSSWTSSLFGLNLSLERTC